jgi:YbbR domain-containing protein
MAMIGFRHIGLKILSIGLAILLWVLVSGEQEVERALRVPLEFSNVPTELEIVSEPPPSVDVRVRGSSGALGRIAPGELIAVLDLRDARPPRRLFHLTPSNVRTPFGVEVVQVTPSSVSVSFERSSSRMVPVLPSIEGEPADGFAVGTPRAQPATVELVGATSALASVTEATTEPVSVAGKSSTVAEIVTVGSPNPSVRLQKPQSVRVTVEITPTPAEWTVPGVAVQIRNAGRPTAVSPTAVTVVARGPRNLSGARAAAFDAWVDVTGFGSGRFELPVHVVPPSQVGVERIEPTHVRVTIR